MLRTRHLTPAVLFILFTIGCSKAPEAPPDRRSLDERNIRDSEVQWNRDYVRNDIESMVSRYTADAVLTLPNAVPAAGREAIRTALKQAVQDGNFSMRFDNTGVEVARSGDLAWSHGTYESTFTDPGSNRRVSDRGTYVLVYRWEERNWRAAMDIRSSGR